MFKYLDLCVELKKSHIAKEGLFQYRNMFQSVSCTGIPAYSSKPLSRQVSVHIKLFVHLSNPHVSERVLSPGM
jgi:hypothetical protein